jgi:uncharacterized protein (DUF3084 family)
MNNENALDRKLSSEFSQPNLTSTLGDLDKLASSSVDLNEYSLDLFINSNAKNSDKVSISSNQFNFDKHFNQDKESEKPNSEVDSSAIFKLQCQDLVNKINKKREKDERTHAEFQNSLTQWADQATHKVIESLYNKYEDNSNDFSQKLAVVFEQFGRIKKLESELNSIEKKVECLYNEINME